MMIAIVWLINGLLCKVMQLVPRHRQIVSRILGVAHADCYTKAIGVAEICIALWAFSMRRRRLCATIQIIAIAVMNVIEAMLAPDLLLFGRMNAVFAMVFIVLIWYNEFVLGKRVFNAAYSWTHP